MSKVEKKKIGFMSGAPLGVGGVSAAPPAVDATNGDVLAPKGRIRPRMGGSSMVPDAMPGRAPESAVAAPTYNAFTTGMRSGRFDTPPDAKPQQRGHLEDAAIVDITEYTPQRTRESQLVGPDGMPKQVGHLNDAAFVEEGAYDPQHSREVQTSYPDAKPQQAIHDKRGSAVEEMRPEAEAPVFEKDDTRRDGGFFKWLGGLSKKRPGRREGESDDDYDERMTRNNMRIATLADAIRHMGNIYNTSKGAALQKFNSPAAEMQADLDKRKAERARKAAAEADAAYKNANLQIKMDAADADRAYKNLTLGIRGKAQKLAEDRFEHQKGKDEHNAKLADDKFAYKKEQDKIKNGQTDRRIAISAKRAAKSGSGRGGKTSGGKYWFVDKSGKMRYQPNKTMWEQEYYRDYGALPHGESSTSVSTKAYNSKGEEVTTTQLKKGPSMTSQAAQQQNKARASRKNNAKPKKRGWASGFKL